MAHFGCATEEEILISVVPEERENAIEFVEEIKDQVNLSLAHTNAEYDRYGSIEGESSD